MFLLGEGILILIVCNVLGQVDSVDLPPQLPDNYKDVFVAGQSGKPTLGTTTSTCWARGGICIDIRECPSLQMDVGVPGCSWGHKVCCKVHKLPSPTVGISRRYNLPIIKDLQDLGSSLHILALRNSMLLSDLQGSKAANSDERLPTLSLA